MKLSRRTTRPADSLTAEAIPLLDHLVYELVPMKSIDGAIADLPPGSTVSVTCSPNLGLEATQRHTEALVRLGHRPIPHLSARLVDGPRHASELAAWTRDWSIASVFVVAGDVATPTSYEGVVEFLHDFVDADPAVAEIGVTAYPDGHPLIDAATLDEVLLAKQRLLANAGIAGWASTQMCFDAQLIESWIDDQRARGMTLPIHLGVPGVIDRARLMKMGVRLGIGASLRYLSKNRSTMASMLSPGGYDPTELVSSLAPPAARLGIDALHCFTFNSVADTVAWHDTAVARAGAAS